MSRGWNCRITNEHRATVRNPSENFVTSIQFWNLETNPDIGDKNHPKRHPWFSFAVLICVRQFIQIFCSSSRTQNYRAYELKHIFKFYTFVAIYIVDSATRIRNQFIACKKQAVRRKMVPIWRKLFLYEAGKWRAGCRTDTQLLPSSIPNECDCTFQSI